MTTASTGPAIVLSNVQKSYAGVPALRGVSLTIERGEFFGLLGPERGGQDDAGGDRHRTAPGGRRVGVDSGPATVAAEPGAAAHCSGCRPSRPPSSSGSPLANTCTRWARCTVLRRREAVRALRIVGLTDQADQRIDTLSGGQQQRLAIATAMLHQPELIFLDEPTAALDPQARRALWKVLRDLKNDGTTVVYTTHHLEEAEALCDRVAIIVDGAFVAVETPENLAQAAAGPPGCSSRPAGSPSNRPGPSPASTTPNETASRSCCTPKSPVRCSSAWTPSPGYGASVPGPRRSRILSRIDRNGSNDGERAIRPWPGQLSGLRPRPDDPVLHVRFPAAVPGGLRADVRRGDGAGQRTFLHRLHRARGAGLGGGKCRRLRRGFHVDAMAAERRPPVDHQPVALPTVLGIPIPGGPGDRRTAGLAGLGGGRASRVRAEHRVQLAPGDPGARPGGHRLPPQWGW